MEQDKYYIVNCFDRPCEKLIAVLREDGKLYYVHPELAKNWEKTGMSFLEATPLKDFGIKILVNSGVLTGEKVGHSIATYDDGRIREWQGSQSFSFNLPV